MKTARVIIFVLILVCSCKKENKVNEQTVEEKPASKETALIEMALMDRGELLRSPGSIVDSENVKNEYLENKIWWDEQAVFDHKNYLLFYDNKFILGDSGFGKLVIYGEYKIDTHNNVICDIINRYEIETSNKNLFFENYKFYFENDTIAFQLEYKPDSFKNQFKLICIANEKRIYHAENIYIKTDSIYDDEGILVYKYSGGIKKCTAKLNVRERPSVDAKIVNTMNVDEIVEVHARTTQKNKIDGIEDYWYYVDYAVAYQYISVFGYVFGGYLADGKWPIQVQDE